jgi:histidyl-tRNA synthetase
MPQVDAPLRMLFEVEGAGAAYLENLRAPLAAAIPAVAGPLDELTFAVSALETCRVRPVVRAVLARNFEYYSGIVMRVEADGRRLVTGGRYDDLIELVGGRRVPASGFALYTTPLLDVLPSPARTTPQMSVLVQPTGNGPATFSRVYAAALALRSNGVRVETVPGDDTDVRYQLACGDDGTPYELTWPDGAVERFERLDDVARVLASETEVRR